jgi:hypothetical protein
MVMFAQARHQDGRFRLGKQGADKREQYAYLHEEFHLNPRGVQAA